MKSKELTINIEDLTNLLSESPSLIFFIKDTKNNIVKANNSLAELVGKTVPEIEGKSCFDLFPDDADKYYEDDTEIIKTGKPIIDYIEKIEFDGSKHWAKTSKVPIKDDKGQVIGIIGIAINITELIKSNLVLVNTQKSLWSMINYSNFYMAMVDCDLNIKMCNYKLSTDLGYENEQELIGNNWETISMCSCITKLNPEELSKNSKHTYTDVVDELKTKNNGTIKVRWFSSKMENGCLLGWFLIGVPLKDTTYSESEDSLRAYWKDVIEHDRSIITALKETVFKDKNEIVI